MNGSMKALSGSGMASMSEASMDFQPRMLEPSKPKPSSKTSSVNSPKGTIKVVQVPKVSTNFTSTIFAPAFLAVSITLLGVLMFLFFACCYFLIARSRRAIYLACGVTSTKSISRLVYRLLLTGAVITFFAVLSQVQAHTFSFLARTQANDGFHHKGNDGRADDGQCQCHTNGLQLLNHQRLEEAVGDLVLQICHQISVRGITCKKSGHQRTQRAAHGVNAEGRSEEHTSELQSRHYL